MSPWVTVHLSFGCWACFTEVGWGTDEGLRNMSEFPNYSSRAGICSNGYIIMETLLMNELNDDDEIKKNKIL